MRSFFSKLFKTVTEKPRFPAPIIEDPNFPQLDQEYRNPGDDPYIVRINQDNPAKTKYRFHDWAPVAGTSHNNTATPFAFGYNRHLRLERSANKYDRNAIKVIGSWTDDQGNQFTAQIGFVPKDDAKDIAKKYADCRLEARLRVIFLPHDDKSTGFRIEIWTIPKDAS